MSQVNIDLDYLRELEKRDPIKDAKQAIAYGKLRFLSIGGYSLFVPAIDTEDCYVDRNLADMIPGTGDVWSSEEHMNLQKAAYDYAYKFNQKIKEEMEQRRIAIPCINKGT
jgi:hypothetical protein